MGGTPHDSRLSQCNGTTSSLSLENVEAVVQCAMQWQQHTEESYPEPAVQHSTILLQYLQLHTTTYILTYCPGKFLSYLVHLGPKCLAHMACL